MKHAFLVLLLAAATACSKGPAKSEHASKALEHFGEAMKIYAERMAMQPRLVELNKAVEADKDGAGKAQVEFRDLLEKAQEKVKTLQASVKKALDAAEAGLAQNKDDADCLLVRCTLSELTGDLEKAAADAERLVSLRPSDPSILVRRASILNGRGRYAEARKALAEVLAREPANANALAIDGWCAFGLNEIDEASSRLEAAEKGRAGLEARVAAEFDDWLATVREYAPYWREERALRETEAKADNLPRVRLETSRGDIVLELFENEAPNSVANFISLVERQFYDGTKFHRVVDNFMAQGGDPNSMDDDPRNDGQGGPGYAIADELPEGRYRRHFRGSISMANSGPDTNGSQFFLTHRPTGHLNGRHTVFGRVIEGQSVVDSIVIGDVLKHAVVLRKRDHPYRPETK